MNKNLLILPVALVSLLLLFGCLQPPIGNQTSIDFTTIEQSANSGLQDRGAYVITSQAKWQSFWNSSHSNQDPIPSLPQIDFSKETVVAVFMGGKSTGGYSIEIEKISFKPVGSGDPGLAPMIIVNFKETSPAQGDIVTQATTSPYHIVKIPKQSTNNYFFSDGTTNILPIIDFEPVPNNSETVWMSVEPKQAGNVWDNFSIAEPGGVPAKNPERLKLLGFLNSISSQRIEVFEYLERQKYEIVCESLACPKGNEIFIKVNADAQTKLEGFGFVKVSEPIIFADKLSYELKIPAGTGDIPPKFKITILNPLNENIFLEGCNQYGYYVMGDIITNVYPPQKPVVKPFKVCIWEGNAYEIKAGEKAEFEEELELLPAKTEFKQYFLTSSYSTQCDESLLPKPLSQLDCKQNKTIDSLGFRIGAYSEAS